MELKNLFNTKTQVLEFKHLFSCSKGSVVLAFTSRQFGNVVGYFKSLSDMLNRPAFRLWCIKIEVEPTEGDHNHEGHESVVLEGELQAI